MPTYQAKCETCNKIHDYFTSVSRCLLDMPVCCGSVTKKGIFQAPIMYTLPVLENYICPVTDELVSTRKRKHEIEVEHDLVIKEKGMVKNRKGKYKVDDLPEDLKPELKKDINRYKTIVG